MSYIKLFLILILILISTSTSSWAKVLVSPIFDGEFNMDKSACWLENANQEVILYSQDSSESKLKINGKITAFQNEINNTNKAQLACGKNYQFYFAETLTKLKVFIDRKQFKKCSAKIILTTQKNNQTIRDLKLTCSE